MPDVSHLEAGLGADPAAVLGRDSVRCCLSRWMSVLQNSKEEALNNAFKGDDNTGENNIVQELTKEIISEVQKMTGNDVCCDCGAPGDPGPHTALGSRTFKSHSNSQNPFIDFHFRFKHEIKCSSA